MQTGTLISGVASRANGSVPHAISVQCGGSNGNGSCLGRMGDDDIAMYQGDDWGAYVEVNDEAGNPVDLTGYTARAQIRSAVADRAKVVAATLNSAVVGSVIELSLYRNITSKLAGSYVWDLELLDTNDMVTTICRGRVWVEQEVTR